jgi:hypothetical protein
MDSVAAPTTSSDPRRVLAPSSTPEIRPALGSAIRRNGFVHARIGGAPYQLGLQHGEILRDEVRSLLDAVYHHVLYGQPGIVGWGIRRLVRTTARMMAPYIPLRYRAEMAGIAHAADVPHADIVLINCFDDVLANLRLLGSLFGRIGCSTVALLPEQTAEGELICGRNLDYFVESAQGDDPWAATTYLKEHVAVIEVEPQHAIGFTTVGWPGFVGTVTAMSHQQMVVGSMTVATDRNWAFATPAPFLYRRIVEETTTLDGAVDLLARAKRTQGNNVLIGSGAEGAAVAVELTPWRLAVRRAANGWVAATNHFNHPTMTGFHGRYPIHNSAERLTRLGQLCAEPALGQTGRERAIDLLTDVVRRVDTNDYGLVWNPCTVYSTVFAPARGRLWVRTADQPGRTFEEVGG